MVDKKELRHKARRLSIKEGLFASARVSFGDRYLAPFAIAINTSNSMVALLSSISGLLGPLTQIFGSRLIEKHSRKKIIKTTVFIESLIWLPLIALAILFYQGILTNLLPFFLFFFFAIFIIFANAGGPAWFSWVGDLVDEKYRGRWFSKRNMLIGFVSVILTISASFFLDFSKRHGWAMFGFATLFFLAFLARLACWRIFKQTYEPKIKIKKESYFSFGEFVRKASTNNFGRFSIFTAFLNLTTAISGPLVAVYLLRFLQFTYTTYIIIIMSGTVFSLLFLRFWGKISDKYGNYNVLLIATLFIPLIPILWILSKNTIYLVLVPSLIGGVSWAGFYLAATNFIYDNVRPQKRGFAVSYYNMLNGIGIAIGAGIGAILIKFLTVNNPIVIIFFISGILRMVAVFFGIGHIKEIKKEKRLRPRAIKNILIKGAGPTLIEEVHEIMAIKDYLREK
jgi:MFS family permease